MRSRSFAILFSLAALAACSDEFNAPEKGPIRVRVVNSVWQLDSTGALSSAQPRAIDVYFDGSPDFGVVNVPPNSVTGTDGAPDHVQLSEGVHAWSPRLSSPATPTTSLYSNTATPRGEFTRSHITLAQQQIETFMVALIQLEVFRHELVKQNRRGAQSATHVAQRTLKRFGGRFHGSSI